MSSRLVIEAFESSILKNNPLGDPFGRRIPVYLPDGYESSSTRYPVVYVLAGFTGRGLGQLNDSPWDETLPERLDRLIGSGVVRPMIVVMPDCMTLYGGSQYINSSATGRYEDHLTEELVPWIDARYRTLPTREARIVLGKSSGGYGALVLGMRRPDLFGLVADHSGDKYFEYCYQVEFPRCLNALRRFGGARKFLDGFPHPHPRPSGWMDIVNTLAMAACYSPNPESNLGFDLPFDEATGEIRQEVWARWLEHDPIRLLEGHQEALRGLKLLYIECGSRDEYFLHWGARIFVERLRKLGIAHHYEEFDDGHRHLQYRYDRSFARISASLGA